MACSTWNIHVGISWAAVERCVPHYSMRTRQQGAIATPFPASTSSGTNCVTTTAEPSYHPRRRRIQAAVSRETPIVDAAEGEQTTRVLRLTRKVIHCLASKFGALPPTLSRSLPSSRQFNSDGLRQGPNGRRRSARLRPTLCRAALPADHVIVRHVRTAVTSMSSRGAPRRTRPGQRRISTLVSY